MRKLHVGTSPLTNRIYAGHVLKDGATWGDGKQDVTGAACGAVCEHVLANGEPNPAKPADWHPCVLMILRPNAMSTLNHQRKCER